MAGASAATVVAVMPAFLSGASGLFFRDALGVSEFELGISIALFFASSAAWSVAGGRMSDRIGAGISLRISALGSGLTMLAIGLVVNGPVGLSLLLAFAGVFNGVAQPASNLALAHLVTGRPGLLFGIKQSAVPIATIIAGASVPLVSLRFGWRWSFLCAGAFSLVVASLVPSRFSANSSMETKPLTKYRPDWSPLLALALAAGVGTGAAVSLGSFLVDSAVFRGMEASSAGWLLVAGSVAGIGARLAGGMWADRRRSTALVAVSAMLVLGAMGYLLLALGGSAGFIVGGLVAYGGGWGWPGLLNYAIVEFHPRAPAAASGIVLTGAAAGASLGPFAFGHVVASASFQTAWIMAAIAAFVAAVLVIVAQGGLANERDW